MAKVIGQYKGKDIYAGSDADVARQMKAIESGGSTPSSTQYPTTAQKDAVPSRNDTVSVLQGDYGEKAADAQYKRDSSSFVRASEPRLTAAQSVGYAKNYGLQGISDKEFVGLTGTEAAKKALKLQKERQAQTSAMTSYAFNPQTISGFSKTLNDMKIKLDEMKNDPFSNRNEKKNKSEAILKSYENQLAKMFDSVGQFQSALQDPNFQKQFQQYNAMGGDPNNIAAAINQSPVVSVTGETPNPDGSYNVQYSDGQSGNVRYKLNPDGTYSAEESQSLTDYLGAVSSPAEKKAFESLIPEQKVYQDQIASEQSIPEQYRQYYFGTEEQIGFLEQERKQKEEEIKLMERQAKLDEKNARAQANLLKDKARAEMDIEQAKIEENRLAAKNYMTGMLAKLGALQTTGAAPQALATLEQKYQKQSQQLRTDYDFYQRGLDVKLTETVDNIGLERDENILKIKSDLSKSEEEVWKEIFRLQNDADRRTFTIVEKYAQEFRTQKEKYVKEAKDAAEKYAKELASTIGAYDVSGLNFDKYLKTEGERLQATLLPSANLSPFLKKVMDNPNVSPDVKDIISGVSKISDYTPTEQKKIRNSLRSLGIAESALKGASTPPAGELLKEARAAIDSGKDKNAVRQRFLEAYPEKSAAWDAYFEE